MKIAEIITLHQAGWSREEVLAMMRQEQMQQVQPQQAQPQQVQPQKVQPQQVQEIQPQQVQQIQPQQVQEIQLQQVQQIQPQQAQPQESQAQESETVQLLREMLGMIRGNNINTMTGETRAVDAAEILAANDYGFDKGGKT